MITWIFCMGCFRAFEITLPISDLEDLRTSNYDVFKYKMEIEQQAKSSTKPSRSECPYENCTDSLASWCYWVAYRNYIINSTICNASEWPEIPILGTIYDPQSVEDKDTMYEEDSFEEGASLSFGKFFRMFIVKGGSFYDDQLQIKSALQVRQEIRSMLKGI